MLTLLTEEFCIDWFFGENLKYKNDLLIDLDLLVCFTGKVKLFCHLLFAYFRFFVCGGRISTASCNMGQLDTGIVK